MEYCQDYYDVDGCNSFDCELPLDHEGDHEHRLTWPKREPSPPAEPTATTEAIQRIWMPQITAMLRGGPIIHNTPPEDPQALTISFKRYSDGEARP